MTSSVFKFKTFFFPDRIRFVVVLHVTADRDARHHLPGGSQKVETADFSAHLPPLDHVLSVVDRRQMGTRWFV